jgi:hypothetical protein
MFFFKGSANDQLGPYARVVFPHEQCFRLRDFLDAIICLLVGSENAKLDNPDAGLRGVSNALSERLSRIRPEDEEIHFAEMIRQEHDRLIAAAAATVRAARSK